MSYLLEKTKDMNGCYAFFPLVNCILISPVNCLLVLLKLEFYHLV